ncbi:hypothetical protein ACFXHA_17110 [Nocardia sp. NPDC059240]|uniref:hypothetical protein n=1 Tax=Nocardia sp. NPDC059240 TaxID=3346786 RepID=UPI003676EE1A
MNDDVKSGENGSRGRRFALIGTAAALVVLLAVTVIGAVLMNNDRNRVASERDRVTAELAQSRTELAQAKDDVTHARAQAPDDERHAEQVATDYAVGAATVDYRDFDAWMVREKTNIAPQLAAKLDKSAPQLRSLLAPLQWVSTSTPITAKVMSASNGVYQVDVFLNESTTSTQSATPNQTTVVYNITVDRGAGWQITDIGGNGIGS